MASSDEYDAACPDYFLIGNECLRALMRQRNRLKLVHRVAEWTSEAICETAERLMDSPFDNVETAEEIERAQIIHDPRRQRSPEEP